jgi:Na+/phosphate symporter
MVMWMLGILLLLAGAYLLYFEANLSRWVSIGVITAGVLLFIGLAMMSFAGNSTHDTRTTSKVTKDGRDVVVDRPRTYVERERRVH